MKNLFVYFYALLLIVCIPNYVKAANEDVIFSMSCDRDTVYKNEEITFKLSVKAMHDINLSTFKLSIKFDSEKLKFKDLSTYASLSDSEIEYNLNDSTLDIVFLTDDVGVNISKLQEINLLNIDFKALGSTGGSKICIDSEVEGVGNFDEEYLYTSSVNDVFIEVGQKPKFDCRLKLLTPSEGGLCPDFNADVFDYELDVPSDCKEIDFDAIPVDDDASVKINKHKLEKSGEETKIKISVCSPDKNNKNVYRVAVKREAKESNENVVSRKSQKEKEDKVKNKSGSNSRTAKGKKSAKKGAAREMANANKNGDKNNFLKETNLDIDSNGGDGNVSNRNLILRENGFSFIIFIIVVFFVVLFLFFIWKHRKESTNNT